MATGQLGATLRHLRGLAAPGHYAARSDRDLLCAYLDHSDQDAITALVKRHGPLVLGVCRRVLLDAHGAEDAFQATFLLLARNGAGIRKQDSLASWLHGVAYRVARNAKRAAARRRRHETEAHTMRRTAAGSDVSWREVQAVLDEELQRLPEPQRAAFVLCCLEGRSSAEAARELAVTAGAVWNRVAKARKLLRKRLAARGVTLSALLGVAALSENGLRAAVPADLLRTTVQAVTLPGAGHAAAGLVSAEVLRLVKGAHQAMLSTRAKLAILLLALLGLTGTGLGLAGPQPGAERAAAKRQQGAAEVRWKAAGVLDTHDSAVLCLAFGPGQVVVSGDEDGYVRVRDAATKKRLPFYKPDARIDPIVGITYAPDDSWVSFRQKNAVHMAFGDKYLKDGIPTDYGIGYGVGNSRPLAIASDGKTYAFGSPDTQTVNVAVWDFPNGGNKERGIDCKGHGDEVLCAAFAPDDALLVTGGADKTARVGEASSGNEKQLLRGHTDSVLVVAFSPDGKLIATGGRDGLVKIWDAGGKERASLKGHSAVRCLAFAPDGKALASGGEDRTLRVWDVGTGRQRAALKGHTDTIHAVGFTRDGQFLVSAGQDRTVRLWKQQK
jgi:RNA polymerase sigma factor (sigma-70 family)